MKVGDAIASFTKALGIEPCDQCKRRQVILNNMGEELRKLFGGNDETSDDAGPTGPGSGRAGITPEEPR